MPSLPRLACPGTLYHVTARGVQQAPLFADDIDRAALIKYIARALEEGDARAFAYCLMGNHYHLVLQTSRPNLSALMQRINSGFGQSVNRRHERSGHLLEGRFKAVVVDRDNYLLEVCRYVDLNPVRAGLVEAPSQWRWSSYAAHTGGTPVPAWLATAELHGALRGRPGDSDDAIEAGRRGYAEWVAAGRGIRLWDESLRLGHYLGGDAFVARMTGMSVAGDRGQA